MLASYFLLLCSENNPKKSFIATPTKTERFVSSVSRGSSPWLLCWGKTESKQHLSALTRTGSYAYRVWESLPAMSCMIAVMPVTRSTRGHGRTLLLSMLLVVALARTGSILVDRTICLDLNA